jgi:hypothetical protein
VTRLAAIPTEPGAVKRAVAGSGGGGPAGSAAGAPAAVSAPAVEAR